MTSDGGPTLHAQPIVDQAGDLVGDDLPPTERAARRVLVVDDDATIRGFLAEALTDEGYETRVAVSGREALDLLRSWRPDLIVLDLMMPEMDGVAFRAEQRRLPDLADVPIIILSATRDLPERARQLGPAAHFPKPMDLEQLLDTVERLIGTPDISALDRPPPTAPR